MSEQEKQNWTEKGKKVLHKLKEKKKMCLVVGSVTVIVIVAGIVTMLSLRNTKENSMMQTGQMFGNRTGAGEEMVTASGTTSLGFTMDEFEPDYIETDIYIEEVYVSAGDEVQAGTPVFKVAEENIEEVKEELEEKKAETSLAYRAGLISYEQSKINAKYTYDLAVLDGQQAEAVYQSALKTAENKLQQAKDKVTEAEENLEKYADAYATYYYEYDIDEYKERAEKNNEYYYRFLAEYGFSESDTQGSGFGNMGGQNNLSSSNGSKEESNLQNGGNSTNENKEDENGSGEGTSDGSNEGSGSGTGSSEGSGSGAGSSEESGSGTGSSEGSGSGTGSSEGSGSGAGSSEGSGSSTGSSEGSGDDTGSNTGGNTKENNTNEMQSDKESETNANGIENTTEKSSEKSKSSNEKSEEDVKESSTDYQAKGLMNQEIMANLFTDSNTTLSRLTSGTSLQDGWKLAQVSSTKQSSEEYTRRLSTIQQMKQNMQASQSYLDKAWSEYKAAAEQMDAQVRKLKVQIESLRADLEEAETTYKLEVLEAETAYKKSLAQSELAKSDYEAAMQKAEDELENLEDEKTEAEEHLTEFESLIGDGVFYTKNAGTVMMVGVRGESTLQGGSMVVAYRNAEDISVTVAVSQEDINKLEVGNEAQVMVENYGTFEGTITYLNPISTSDSRTNITYEVIVDVNGEDISSLKENLTATVIFVTGDKEE